MRHVEDIRALVKTLQQSTKFHALIIQSPPGWAKSSTIDRVMNELGVSFRAFGSYSTPLFLYNAICESPDQILVVDDCAGLFEDPTAMAVLKAATWASAGTEGARRVTWNSTSGRAKQSQVEFNGKLILLANNLPIGRNTEAFLSRTLHMSIAFDTNEIQRMLTEAAQDLGTYPQTNTVLRVVEFLSTRLTDDMETRVNLRTLQMGYEIAVNNPENWEALLERLLPQASAQAIAGQLTKSGLPVEEQAREFIRLTGKSRRTFFNYRQNEALTNTPEKVQVAQVCVPESGVANG